MSGMEHPVKTLIYGNWLMALCGGFYLAWWIVVFRPPKPRNSPVGSCLLALAFLTGIAGFYLCGRALTSPPPDMASGVRSLWIAAGGAAAYIVLLAGSVLFFHRQVTSELLIIVVWTVLELCVVDFLSVSGTVNQGAAMLLAAVVLASALASLVCYLLYYRLPYTAGYISGCIPLVLAILTIIAINLTAYPI